VTLNINQSISVATHVRCGQIFITKTQLTLTVKKFRKSVSNWPTVANGPMPPIYPALLPEVIKRINVVNVACLLRIGIKLQITMCTCQFMA